MTSPAVSVALPVFNAGATLAEALDSIRAQTLADHEVVVALNGCTDASEAIARRYAAEDSRVRVLGAPRPNLVTALNAALAAARAPVVARLDADDLMTPGRLAAQLGALRAHPEWTVVASGVTYATLGGAPPGRGFQRFVAWLNGLTTPQALRHARFVDAPVAHPATAYRRDAVLAAGGYRDGAFAEDHELWLRLFERGAVFGKLAEVGVLWRDRPDRMTRADGRYAEDARRGLVQRYLVSGPLAGGRRARLWGGGRAGRRHAKGLAALGVAIDDIVDIDPAKVGRRVAGGIPIVAPESLGPPDGRLVVVAVAAAGARAEVCSRLEALGYAPERDYLAIQ